MHRIHLSRPAALAASAAAALLVAAPATAFASTGHAHHQPAPDKGHRNLALKQVNLGNFGDGRINIFAKEGRGFAGHATGQILDAAAGKPFAEPGLWQILPGTAATGGTNALWFTAGINDEADGLLGVLRP